MKKVIFFLAAICMMAVTMISFSSCENEGGDAPSVEGTWVGKAKRGSITNASGTTDIFADCTFTFTKDKATITVGKNEPVEYTYKKKGPVIAGDNPYLVFYYSDGNEAGSLHYRVNGETLTFTGTDGTWGMGYVGTFTLKK